MAKPEPDMIDAEEEVIQEETSSPNGFNVGARLRAFRTQKGMSIDVAANRTGVSKSFLSRFERDLVQASIATLLRYCEVLDVKPGAIFDPPPSKLVRAGEGAPINLGGVGMEERIIGGVGNEHMMALRSTIAPGGGSGVEPYALKAALDLVHVVRGELEITIGGEEFRLSAGDTLSFDPSIPHTWRNPSRTKTCDTLWMIVPPPA
ncbi:transcriptional regulator, XRE family with cupin sensor [Faunimonas pinastri]|uniref:Transcriptional regulator, XRE family with cupin sensor n=1 Tax=Faunimonas pinastri TaxID=1855383 RepID=A0A1H9AZT0_9HYPH|nr:cupin domain-containing protein [Faunimonas pinastri]SEP82292.1 transcriptional regulator, XRE family with cupin sensor [Faunimonas pinastri]